MCSVSSLVSDFASPIWTMRVRRSPMRASQIRRRSSSSRRSLSHSVGRPQNGSMAHCRASSMPHMRRSLASRSSSSTFRSAASFARFLAASASSSAVLRSLARFIFASSFNRARSSNLRWCASRSLSSRRLLASSMSCTWCSVGEGGRRVEHSGRRIQVSRGRGVEVLRFEGSKVGLLDCWVVGLLGLDGAARSAVGSAASRTLRKARTQQCYE
mmetsp:Transcript_5104/g.11249  ORF Transcript_5104/g.11249 Transcript_5104/m.11249 type:complete len:214 (+) Transcript_5104:208-849(+)